MTILVAKLLMVDASKKVSVEILNPLKTLITAIVSKLDLKVLDVIEYTCYYPVRNYVLL
ncbi:hypothetical protein [Solibacillus sp. R5-41]|uniref:hypothetical protein n=1 Tax=Solibacillus sp. R5-41 TaxID=2048654 RepID=UPI0012FE6039|nr:hypothetical protein [Solibacillus sp. R5-41]